MKYLKPFNESNEEDEEDELTTSIRDILADATDEGIELKVDHHTNINFLKQNKLDVILHKFFNRNQPFKLKDIKTGVDSLINMLNDEGYKLISVDIVDVEGAINKYDIEKHISPWDYAQKVIINNRLERTYRELPLKIVKLVFKSN